MSVKHGLDEAVLKNEVAQFTGISNPEIRVEKLAGDASAREYFRVYIRNWRLPTAVLMRFDPAQALTSEEFVGRKADTPKELPFLTVQRFLAELNLPVPAVYLDASEQGRVWLEDLGDTRLYELAKDATPQKREPLYRQAIDLLVDLQTRTSAAAETCPLVSSKRFNRELLRWELDHFREWMIEAYHGVRLSPSELAVVDKVFDTICERIEQMPYLPVHRDFQSKNLFFHNDQVYVIDFQDMLIGPLPYDLVALLRDSYVVLTEAELKRLIEYYNGCALDAGLPQITEQDFYLVTLHRKMKDSGRFVFIDRVKGNPSFLQYIPASLEYVRDAFSRFPEFADALEVFARYENRLKL